MILDNLRNQSKTDDIGQAPEVSNELKIMQTKIELLHRNIDKRQLRTCDIK